jgi:O-antigen ligase
MSEAGPYKVSSLLARQTQVTPRHRTTRNIHARSSLDLRSIFACLTLTICWSRMFQLGGIEILTRPQVIAVFLTITVAGYLAFGDARTWARVTMPAATLALLSWMFLSISWINNVYSFRAVMTETVAIAIAVCVVGSTCTFPELRRYLIFACESILIFQLLYSIAFWGRATSGVLPGWHGSFYHKNWAAYFLVTAIPVIWCFDRSGRRLPLTLLAGLLLVMCQSGSGLTGGVLSASLLLWFRLRESSSRLIRPWITTFYVFCTALVVILVSQNFNKSLALIGEDPTLTQRTLIWKPVLEAIKAQPLKGYGVGGIFYDGRLEPTRTIVRQTGFPVYQTHNYYLATLATIGLVGMFLTLFLTLKPLVLLSKKSIPFEVRRLITALVISNLFVWLTESPLDATSVGLFTILIILTRKAIALDKPLTDASSP